MLSSILVVAVILGAVALGIALAYVPLRLLLAQMARNVQQFIERQRERRAAARDSPERRKA